MRPTRHFASSRALQRLPNQLVHQVSERCEAAHTCEKIPARLGTTVENHDWIGEHNQSLEIMINIATCIINGVSTSTSHPAVAPDDSVSVRQGFVEDGKAPRNRDKHHSDPERIDRSMWTNQLLAKLDQPIRGVERMVSKSALF